MNYERIIYEKKNGIATITMNRPEVLNAINQAMMTEIMQAMNDAERDLSVLVLVFKGAGRAFSSGFDIKEMGELTELCQKDPHAYIRYLQEWEHTLMLRIRKFEKPTIAAVNGYAIGLAHGMALLCDMRVASMDAKFGPRFVKIGLVPGEGETFVLPALVGYGHAMEYLLTGEYITAEEAYRIGLANRIVPLEQLDQATQELAQKLMDASPIAVASVKAAMNRILMPALQTELEFSVRLLSLVKQTHDHKEAIQALREKRKPKYIGH
jgi:enoyl-CoA hydratase/carnithine racemase